MADPVIYDVTTEIVPEQIIEIPATIKLPELRYAAPSGSLSKDCVVEGTITVKDKDGVIVPLEFSGFKVTLKDWPEGDQEILGVLYMNFTIANKAPVAPVEPEIVEEVIP